ncbi:zinc-dependent alcohol dehydrogenase family protein [Pseudonocardia spinosispora]|uniref:zinc-dependent alcohol dehydrogenase family protein n=1 Tax=Pseudonocardia spinosispora TaxID=103441 RepID=UPI00041460BD|nr:zinc-dependent alcohol dehydrogenase family protein [Pseudonocardia spinosispora]
MVRTIRFHELGGPEVLRIEDHPVRDPDEGEVRIRVDAIGLNRSEVNFRRGTYLDQPNLPAGLGTEAAGEVLAVGVGVERWEKGDQVCVLPSFSQNDYPVYAEEAIVPARALMARPPGMDAVTGCAVWMPYVTVYGMVAEVTRVRPGDHVVVTAPNNSIGVAALQVLRYLGAVAIAVAADGTDRTTLLKAGAHTVIDADSADVSAAIREATGGRGAALVLDAVGGPGVADLVAACAPGAVVIVHGGLSGEQTPLPAGRYAPVWLRRYTLFEVTGDPAALRRAEHFVRSGLAVGALVPLVDRVFDFEDVAEAHTYLDSPDRAPGKPVLRVRND